MESGPKAARPGLLRAAVVVAFVLALGAQAVRTAAVSAEKSASLPLAARAWADHPQILAKSLLRSVGQAAANDRSLDPSAIALVGRLSRAEPLSPVPFLVKGAVEEKAGNYRPSERLLVEARRRDPRGPAARLLLAQAFLRRGNTLAALEEMSMLSKLVPGSFGPLTATLAAHAQSPGGIGELRRLIAKRPDLEAPLLAALAADPSNTQAILALASPSPHMPGKKAKPPAWQPKLLNALVKKGDVSAARSVWLKITGRPLADTIYNPRFAQTLAPPPFNWTLAQSGGAMAEPDQGRLHVVHFGTEDMVIAEETLLLAPGRYRLSLAVTGRASQPGQLAWRVRCLPAGGRILDLPVGNAPKSGVLTGDFSIPASECWAQRLELAGQAQDFPADADLTFADLKLSRLAR